VAQLLRARSASGAGCSADDSTHVSDAGPCYHDTANRHDSARKCDFANRYHAADNLRKRGYDLQCVAGLRSRSAENGTWRLVRTTILPAGSRLSAGSPLSDSTDAGANNELPTSDHVRSRDRRRHHDRRAALHHVLVAVSTSSLHDVSACVFAGDEALVNSQQAHSNGLLPRGHSARRKYDVRPAGFTALLHTASSGNAAGVAVDAAVDCACRSSAQLTGRPVTATERPSGIHHKAIPTA